VYIKFYEYPIGTVGIAETGGTVCRVVFGNGIPAGFTVKETPPLKRAALQLTEYFEGKRAAFDLPFACQGTVFQRAVWDALKAIPYGETRSYREVAASVGNPRAFRAVGMANHRNPLAIFIPCHRVVETGGGLGGYAGGLPAKQYLLDLEKRRPSG